MGDHLPRMLGNWYLHENLGSGYSGSIYRAQHVHTGQIVALKVQHIDHECPTNAYEKRFLPALAGGKGMPTLFSSGEHGVWDYFAIDLLGPSLENYYKRSGKEAWDLRSVCCIAMQVIDRLRFMHSRGILHRDIQLGNCVVGLPPNEKTVYMIDFGFSKRYIDLHTHRHIPDSRKKRDFIGNYWFSSIRVHCQDRVPSRRDDLEAAGLMFVHLLTPRGLSWTRNGVPKTDEAHERLKEEKRKARLEDLCKGLPTEFEDFLRYCRRLKFQDCPDYEKWIDTFRDLAVELGFPESDDFIWPPPPTTIKVPRRSLGTPADELERVLNGLTDLNLNTPERHILGDRKNVEQAIQKARQAVHIQSDSDNYIVLSGDIDENQPALVVPKARRLKALTEKIGDATDNEAVAAVVLEFIDVLKMNSSRTITKEGFAFLGALHKQLDDPSVFCAPTHQPRNSKSDTDPGNAKLGVVARLQREVASASTNSALAVMVDDFTKVTNRSNGRTITKDGFLFFEGLAKRLKVLL